MLQVKLIYIFTKFAQVIISEVKLITIRSYKAIHITSFAKLRISAFRFTDNVQRNLSRYVQMYNYGIWCGIYYRLNTVRPLKH